MKNLLSYYSGRGAARDKLEHFIRTYLVYDGASVPDELIDIRYQASIDRTWWPIRPCGVHRGRWLFAHCGA